LIKDLINFCWFIFKWGIVPGTILALVALLFLGPRVDAEIRCQFERRLADHYRDLKVTVRSAVRVKGKGIEIRDLCLLAPGAAGHEAAMLHVEQMFLDCDAELADLLSHSVRIHHVTIRRPTLRLARLADGTWLGRELWPPPKFGGTLPGATIENGTVEIIDLAKRSPSTMTFRDVNLTAQNRPRPDGAPPGPPIRVVQGTLSGDHLGRIEIEGQGDPEQLDWQVTGTIHELDISPELRGALPAPLAEQLAALAGFRGRASLKFVVQSDAAAASGCRFSMSGQVTEGRLDDPRLPYPWTGIHGTIAVNNEGFVVENLSAQGGRSTLWISRGQCGFGPQSPWSVNARITQLTLDERSRALLAPSMQQTWDKFRPAGEIDVTAELRASGGRLDLAASKATVQCKDVAFAYHKFPYLLEHGRGTLVLENDTLAMDLVAASGNRPVRLSGELKQPLSGAHGWIEATGQDMPIDDKLRAAILNEKTQNTFRLLAPGGWCDFRFRAWRERPSDEYSRHVVLDVKDGTIRYQHFPYPLERIRGQIERLPDGTWEFRDLRGVNDTAAVSCSGRLADGPQGKQLALWLSGKNVPLDKELHDALKPAMQQAWDNLEPRGMIDLEEARITWWIESKRLELTVQARPQPGTASIKPKMFPYQMDQLDGTLVYRDGHVEVDKFRGVHGRTSISGRGDMSFLPAGSWDIHLRDVWVDRLDLGDRELVGAMPGRLREGLATLNASGNLYLRNGKLNVRHSGTPGEPPRTDWDVRLGLQPGQIGCGIRLENVRGEMSLCGKSDGKSHYSLGELDVESLTYKKLQFTELRGPLWIDDGRVLLGSWVGRRTQNPDGTPVEPPRALTAKLFGGTVTADAWIAPANVPCYALQAELLGADLAQFATETMPGQQDLKGRVGVRLGLTGVRPTTSGLRGGGEMWLRDGDVYKLPLMGAVLKILSMREPDASAFSEANIRFQIAGDHIYASPIEFNGDAISLVGQGEMDFLSNVDMAFYAVVGRNRWRLPIISPIVGEASRQTMTIKIRGPLQNPDASRDVLPGVKEALRELEANLRAAPAGSPASSPWPATGRSHQNANPGAVQR